MCFLPRVALKVDSGASGVLSVFEQLVFTLENCCNIFPTYHCNDLDFLSKCNTTVFTARREHSFYLLTHTQHHHQAVHKELNHKQSGTLEQSEHLQYPRNVTLAHHDFIVTKMSQVPCLIFFFFLTEQQNL